MSLMDAELPKVEKSLTLENCQSSTMLSFLAYIRDLPMAG